MSLLRKPLLEFATHAAPQSEGILHSGRHPLPDSVRKTNTEFLLKVALAGVVAIKQEDPYSGIQHLRFEDCINVYHGFRMLLNLANTGRLAENAEATLKKVPASLTELAAHHEGRQSQLTEHKKNTERQLSALQHQFNIHMRTRNYDGLLAEYNYFSDRFGTSAEEAALPGGVSSLTRKRNISQIIGLFKKEVDYAAINGIKNVGWLRVPDSHVQLREEIERVAPLIQKYAQIGKDIRHCANEISLLVEEQPLFTAKVYQWPGLTRT